jgi:PmbA protein
MKKQIIELLKKEELYGWRLISTKTTSHELFFIKDKLDMNRMKDVTHYHLTVYLENEKDGNKYIGSSTTQLPPTMSVSECEQAIKEAIYSSTFVFNEPYKLEEPKEFTTPDVKSVFGDVKPTKWLSNIVKDIYQFDNEEYGGINSTEFFINEHDVNICLSTGIDYSYKRYVGQIELVYDWNQGSEPVELYEMIDFADYDVENISDILKSMIENVKQRAVATKTPQLEGVNVIFNGKSVKRLFEYYHSKSSTGAIYQKLSNYKLDENVQGETTGDLVSMKLLPYLEGSSANKLVDGDGVVLVEQSIIEDGVLKKYHGSSRFSQYVNAEVTGSIPNVSVNTGSTKEEEMKANPYLEVLTFSDFDVNPLTGNFGGEIRLAYYNDGNEVIPVTGGSVTGVMTDLHKEFYLSKEMKQHNNFIGPKLVMSKNVSISGN